MCLVCHAISSRVFLMGNALFVVVMCISYSLSSRKNVRVMGDLEHACCLSLDRCRDPLYLAAMYLVKPWYMVPNWLGSLRACINCWPIHCM